MKYRQRIKRKRKQLMQKVNALLNSIGLPSYTKLSNSYVELKTECKAMVESDRIYIGDECSRFENIQRLVTPGL